MTLSPFSIEKMERQSLFPLSRLVAFFFLSSSFLIFTYLAVSGPDLVTWDLSLLFVFHSCCAVLHSHS